nr:MAG: hypothetical protein DIU58_13715 [Sphaerobacter thermophilus]
MPPAAVTSRYGVRYPAVKTIGRALRPEVAIVEVEYDDGAVQQTGLTNGVFALFREASTTCAIRAYDAQERLLHEVRVPNDPSPFMHFGHDAPGACRE